MPSLTVRTMPVSRIKPARYNPRKPLAPTSPAYRKLRSSIERFGLVEPLIWNATSGRLVGGHARLRILKDLGLKQIPVSVVRLAPAAEKALNIVLNNKEAQGRYDPEKLANLLEALKGLPEFEASGFSLATLRTLTLAPVDPQPTPPPLDRVEVILVIPAERYEAIEPKLDAVVREYDLESHVVWGSRVSPQRHRGHRESKKTKKK